MMEKPRCANCRFWWDESFVDALGRNETKEGDCRRYPPVLVRLPCIDENAEQRHFAFPVTYNDDCCGEWQKR